VGNIELFEGLCECFGFEEGGEPCELEAERVARGVSQNHVCEVKVGETDGDCRKLEDFRNIIRLGEVDEVRLAHLVVVDLFRSLLEEERILEELSSEVRIVDRFDRYLLSDGLDMDLFVLNFPSGDNTLGTSFKEFLAEDLWADAWAKLEEDSGFFPSFWYVRFFFHNRCEDVTFDRKVSDGEMSWVGDFQAVLFFEFECVDADFLLGCVSGRGGFGCLTFLSP